MNSLKYKPAHFRLALLSNLPFLLFPFILLITNLLGVHTDNDGNNWGDLVLIFNIVYWVPAFVVLLSLLMFSGEDSKFSRNMAYVSIVFGIIASTVFVFWPWLERIVL